jgi:hypothetical protein
MKANFYIVPYILFFLVFCIAMMQGVSVYACKDKNAEKSCKKEVKNRFDNPEKSNKSNNSCEKAKSKNSEHEPHSCNGNCEHSGCNCSNSCGFINPVQFYYINSVSRFEIEINWQYLAQNTSSVYLSVWLLPKINC